MNKTFNELFEEVAGRGTNYEIAQGIKVINKEIIIDTEDIKLAKIEKSTGEIGLCIFYRSSTKIDNWVYWYPSANQQKQLLGIAQLLNKVDEHNKQFWSKK